MDSESPVAFGIAGQERVAAGTSFTSDARKFPEFRFDLDGDAAGGRSPPRSPRHRRPADGDGR